MSLCGTVIIPSLFPFLVLAAALPNLEAGLLLCAPARLLGGLYAAPPRLAPALLMSWLGGYPAGAKVLAGQLDAGELSSQNVERALCFCVNSGPAFLVTVVGLGLFGDLRVGAMLLGCQLLAGVLTARLLLGSGGVGALPPCPTCNRQYPPMAELLVSSVTAATTATLSICAFVVLMGALSTLLTATGVTGALCTGLERISGGWLSPDAAGVLVGGSLEICGGCALAAGLPPLTLLTVVPFLLSFGGLSVLCQVAAMVGGRGVRLGRFVLSRFLHGLLTGLLAYPLLRGHCTALPVGLLVAPKLYVDDKTLPGTLLLLALVATLCRILEPSLQEKRGIK